MKKPDKIVCEICNERDVETLHYHHIIERTEKESTEHAYNLAIICSNCHNKVHAETINIIGLYPSTKMPYKRTLIYDESNKKNKLGLMDPYCNIRPKVMRIYEQDNKCKDSK